MYSFDGFELDFARHTPCLPPGRQWELREHATAFVRGVREMLLAVAEERGTPILLAAKVPGRDTRPLANGRGCVVTPVALCAQRIWPAAARTASTWRLGRERGWWTF